MNEGIEKQLKDQATSEELKAELKSRKEKNLQLELLNQTMVVVDDSDDMLTYNSVNTTIRPR
jgi:hypothetical protein